MTLITPVQLCTSLESKDYDVVVVVGTEVSKIPRSELAIPLKQHVTEVDPTSESGVFVVKAETVPSKRIVFAGTGPLDKDYDDVRSFAEAALKGVKKAVEMGCKTPLLYVHSHKFEHALLVAILGGLEALYVPLEVRDLIPEKSTKAKVLGVFSESDRLESTLKLIEALESGRIVSRDIGGSDPERMAAPEVEKYVRNTFADSDVKVEVVSGQSTFEKEYPCFAAVNRAASGIPRHDGRVIWLTYQPEGPVNDTVMLVGKGITYDTGGADIKAGGIMAGMSRDKCGAADVAGFVKTISVLKPKGLKVVAAMAMARNSVGSNCYVSDEIIVARSGVRIRVGNTDAEGRMAMVDVLCHMKEKALKEANPHLMTIATLTGHAVLALGSYSSVMDNGPAKGFAEILKKLGDEFGDPFEVSTMRKEDFKFIRDPGEYVDIIQCNNAASSRTPRGHQFPGAFLQTVSGLDKHMTNSEHPLKYSHLDVAGSSGSLPDIPTGSSIVALAMHFNPSM